MRVSVGHALCREDADTLAETLRELLPEVSRVSVTELGSALGVHGGPGTLLVATMPEFRPAGNGA